MTYDNKTLQRIVAYLQLRFPVAELSRELEFDKSTISNWLNGNKPISQSFIDRLEAHYKISVKDFMRSKVVNLAPSLEMDNLKEVAVFVAENKDALMKDPLFSAVLQSLCLEFDRKSRSKVD